MRQRDDDRLDGIPNEGPAASPTCDDWLRVVRPHLGTDLASPSALDSLHTLARQLPGDAVAALEARLAPGVERLDLSLRILRSDQARNLSGRFPLEFLGSLVSSLWLEFDSDRLVSGGGPVVCAGLRGKPVLDWITESLLPALHGGPLSRNQKKIVGACCAAIPEGARLLYAFSLRPRGTDEVRLEALGFDPPGIVRYLERVAPEAVPAIEEILPIFDGVERLHLSLDIGERISSRFGIEGSFQRLPAREAGWEDLFARLEERGLCDPAKRRAALAWPGHDSFRTAAERWPAGAGRTGLFCVRSLSHVKVVGGPGREPEAKVYLLITPFRKEAAPSPDPGGS